MNRQVFTLNTTRLASIIIALAGLGTLLVPIAPSIIRVPASPSGIILTDPFFGTAPLLPTLPITEMMVIDLYLIRLTFYLLTTRMTMDNYTFPVVIRRVEMLPLPVTCHTAKWTAFLRSIFQVSFSFERFTTLATSQRHTGCLCQVPTLAGAILGRAGWSVIFRNKLLFAVLTYLCCHSVIIAQLF